jgi:RimK family alpha-L-glutamate ligase
MKIWILIKYGTAGMPNNCRWKEAADELGIECYFINAEDIDLVVTKEGKSSVYYRGQLVNLPDCLIPRRGSGTTYFDLAIIRHLESLGVMVLNSANSIEIAKDKLATLQLLNSNNLPIPKTVLAKFPIDIKVISKEFNFPLVLKTVSGPFGKGVFLCESKNKLKDTMDLIEISRDPKVNVILQEFVKSSKGKDIRVIVVGGRAIGSMLRTAKKGKFKANYSAGGSVEKLDLSHAIEWLAVESARLLNLEIAGVDLLFDGESYSICEVNSAPGFEGFEKATGIDVPKEVYEFIKVRLGKE